MLASSTGTSSGRAGAHAGATRRTGITSSAHLGPTARSPPTRSASFATYSRPAPAEALALPSSSGSGSPSSHSSSSRRALSRSLSSTPSATPAHADAYQALLLRRTQSGTDVANEPLYQDLQLSPSVGPGPLPAQPGTSGSPYYEDLQLAAPLPSTRDEVSVPSTPDSPASPTWPSPGTSKRAAGSRLKHGRPMSTPYGQMPSASEWAQAHEAEDRQVAVASGSALGASGRRVGLSRSGGANTGTSSQYAAIPRRSESRRAALASSSRHSSSRARLTSSSTGSDVQRTRR